ncbi:MAG TPA: phosphotransferase [Symbiobacteriaceae bacterium]|nr:phosphotransferase [Symbiobacteriaceae bacterium]
MMKPLELLTRQYGLADAELSALPFTGGALKSVYRVEAGGRSYVFKRYRPDFRSPEDVVAMHDAQAFLAEAGIPVARAVPDRAGRVATPDEGACWVLYEWVGGRHPVAGCVSTREAAVWGELLGRLDLRLADWQTSWPGAEPLQIYPVAERVALFADLIRHAERGGTERDAACLVTLRQNLKGIEAMAGLVPELLAMPRQWVHGDPNEGNVLMADGGDRVLAVLDFDNMRQAPRGFDFMYSLCAFFPQACPERDDFARAYFRTVRPTPGEVALYAPLRAYWELCDVWPIDWLYLEPHLYDAVWDIPRPTTFWQEKLDATTEWLLRIAQ